MWRSVRTMLMSLFLGVVFTYLSAWVVAARLPLGTNASSHRSERPAPAQWPYARPDDWPEKPDIVKVSHYGRFKQVRFVSAVGDRYGFVIIDSGFPVPALSWAYRQDWNQQIRFPQLRAMDGVADGIRIPESLRSDRLPGHVGYSLPLIPYMPGFMWNVLVWSVLGWLGAFVAPRALLRLLRRINHRCQQCGYDAQGLSTCPECGSRTHVASG